MCDCQNHVADVINHGLILHLFLMGIASSFSHCIGMCGSIAMSQATAKILGSLKRTNQFKKALCAVAWEYYIGKAITYALLTCIMIICGRFFKHTFIFKIIKVTALSCILVYFIITVISSIMAIMNCTQPNRKSLKNKTYNFNIKILSSLSRSSCNYHRLLIGMCLGLIPCGVSYGAIGTIAGSTSNILTGSCAAVAFGLGTFPGLFILSYSGYLFFHKFKKILDIVYICTLIWNIKIIYEIF